VNVSQRAPRVSRWVRLQGLKTLEKVMPTIWKLSIWPG